jgi:hypothetical protein
LTIFRSQSEMGALRGVSSDLSGFKRKLCARLSFSLGPTHLLVKFRGGLKCAGSFALLCDI